ncbi:hypothetical protein [Thiocapsa marina]|uniref:Uncharacterized protein n=1 Tax=Thiocapsa marina 5811 TaxID=768671 RepID=F9UEC6_9GAMM|nr:hypothetical protein [Thiocapsa marina]EGV17247.1 hypothetical protein ThimaDRAFT_3279 [Thiocapsa marina 5811]
MTEVPLCGRLLLFLVYATAHQAVLAAEPWEQARQPAWDNESLYLRGYKMPPVAQDRDPRYPDAYRADDVRLDTQGNRSGTGYGDYDMAPPGQGGFIDRDGRWRDGRWMEYGREPTGYSRDLPYGEEPDRYSVSPRRGDPGSGMATDDRGALGGWPDATYGRADGNGFSGSANPYPEYRFRGDPQPSSDRWSGSDGTQEYRFRPLTEREAEQRSQTLGWRPLEPARSNRAGRTSPPAGLMDALTPPPRTFGFEPRP